MALVGEVELSANPQRAKIVEVLKSIIGEDSLSINTKYESTFPSLRLPTRFVIASNSVPRLLDASGALAHRFLFVPFEISFVGREDIHLEEKLLAELPGIANWALAGLRRLRAAGGRFTLGEGHKRLAGQYAADTSPIMAWVRSEMVVHRRADPGDLPPECLTRENVSIAKSDAYDLYCDWCESHDVEPTRPAWFGRDLKTLVPKLQEGREGNARVYVYKGIGIRQSSTPDPEKHGRGDTCERDNQNIPEPTRQMAVTGIAPGHPGHLDCFSQLFSEKDRGIRKEKVVENNENAQDAQAERLKDDKPDIESDCKADNIPTPSQNGAAVLSLSGQSGHLDCFAQLLKKVEMDKEKEKVVKNNDNALTALTRPPTDDSEGKKGVEQGGYNLLRKDSIPSRESRRLSRNMRLDFPNEYVAQPDPSDFSIWRVGKDVDGTVRWLDQTGTREWAHGEVQRRLAPKPTTPLTPEGEEDDAASFAGTTADVLNTLICNLDEGKFDLDDPDDLADLECQIAPALDIPETADMADALLIDLDDGSVTLDDVRQRVDEMLAVLLELEENLVAGV